MEQKKTVTDSTHWSIQDAVKYMGKDRETLLKRMSQAGINMGASGRGTRMRWPSSRIIESYYGSLENERILKTRAEREIAELDLTQKRGELINAADIKAVIDKWLSTVSLTVRQLKDKEDGEKLLQILKTPVK